MAQKLCCVSLEGVIAMTDVVEIAKERQARLAAEIGKLDNFIRMAETLVKHSQSKSNKASATEDEKAAEWTDSDIASLYSAPADKNGVEEDREDLSARDLKAGERVGRSRTIIK